MLTITFLHGGVKLVAFIYRRRRLGDTSSLTSPAESRRREYRVRLPSLGRLKAWSTPSSRFPLHYQGFSSNSDNQLSNAILLCFSPRSFRWLLKNVRPLTQNFRIIIKLVGNWRKGFLSFNNHSAICRLNKNTILLIFISIDL